MEQNHAFLLLLLLIYLFFPDSPGLDSSLETQKTLAQNRLQLQVLQNSTWDHPGNVTGLLSSGRTPPEPVRERWNGIRDAVLGRREGTVYSNATGSLMGSWRKLSFPGLPTTGQPSNARNFSGVEMGRVVLEIVDTADGFVDGVGEVKVLLKLRDQDWGDGADVVAMGAHFEERGLLVAATTSERFAGVFAVPHFMLNEAEYNESKKLLVPVIEKAVETMEKTHKLDAPWLPGANGMLASTKPQCEYIVYVQLHPVPDLQNEKYSEQLGLDAKGILRKIEHEMRFPSGVSLPPPPPLQATAMIYSPNCGIVLLANKMQGEKVEPFYSKASHFALGAAAVGVVQLWLLIRQMNESNTLTTVCRVSFWTITMMAVVDGYLFFAFVFIAVFLRACFLPMVAASFCYLMLSAVHGMRFLVTTYRIQRQWRQPTSAAPQSDGLPAPVTAGSPAPANQDSPAVTDEQVDAEIGALHTRFYFTLLAILFFSLNAATWPPFFRDITLCIGLLVVNSYWIPQIYRNIMRGCRKAFQWEFVFGTSVCRLAGVFYMLLYPDNIFRLEPNPKAVALICGWVWIQCVVLVCQDTLGPRFLLPSSLLPPVYDYHSPLPADDEEAAQDMGTRTDGGRQRSFNCVVCMQTVEVPTSGSADSRDGEGSSGGVGLLSRRQYMVTPCRHVFHSHCLEGWMRFRLQCPICRNRLPAL